MNKSDNSVVNKWTLPDRYFTQKGNGYYWFRIRLGSADITEYMAGEWSEYSPAYHYTDGTEDPGTEDPGTETPTSLRLFRLYNPTTGEHLLSTSASERVTLSFGDWEIDGIMCNMPTSGTPIYRLYNPASGEHLYTMVTGEIETLKGGGWSVDGIVAYSASADNGIPIYRLYNSTAQGWTLEGVALFASK